MIRGPSTCWRCLSSSSRTEYPSAVIGILSIAPSGLRTFSYKNSDRWPKKFGHAMRSVVTNSGGQPRFPGLAFAAEIALQRAHLEVSREIGLDSLCCGDGP